MTQRNIDYLERRGLANVQPIDIIALFRIVDENKYVFKRLDLINLIFISIFQENIYIFININLNNNNRFQ